MWLVGMYSGLCFSIDNTSSTTTHQPLIYNTLIQFKTAQWLALYVMMMYDPLLFSLCRTSLASTSRLCLHFPRVSQPYRLRVTRAPFATTRAKMEDPSQYSQSKHTTKTDLDNVPEEDQWKFRAPYRIHEPSDGFKTIYTGACHCAQIQFELNRDAPLATKYCHCVDCQVQHGV
jgi:hypothetical protein